MAQAPPAAAADVPRARPAAVAFAALAEPVQRECLAILLALMSMYWEDRQIPTSDRRNLRDQILPRIEGLVSLHQQQQQQGARPNCTPEFQEFITSVERGVAFIFGKPHKPSS